MLADGADLNQLPLKAWPERELLAIKKAIDAAWNAANTSLCSSEDEYTNELLRTLNELRHDNIGKNLGFTKGRYQDVSRGANLEKYDGSTINSQPDVTIRKVNSGKYISPRFSHLNALFIECKIIDVSKGIGLYYNNGITRYIEGQYSWSMNHSMMIAYVKNNKTTNDLKTYLAANGHKRWKTVSVSPISTHNRAWKYNRDEYSKGCKPGEIKLYHIWLKV